jgi:hypothetical protein
MIATSLTKQGLFTSNLALGLCLLYNARAVDAAMLPAINEIGGSQASPTQKTQSACKMLLDYAATYPTAIIRYHASNMALHIDSDAAYLVLPNACSRYAGHYFLSDYPTPPPAKPTPKPNGAILKICKTIPSVNGLCCLNQNWWCLWQHPAIFHCVLWAILSLLPQSKPATLPLTALCMQISSNAIPNHGTCNGTGFVIKPRMNSYGFTGTKGEIIKPTILQNTILQSIIFLCTNNMF